MKCEARDYDAGGVVIHAELPAKITILHTSNFLHFT